jgi:hypothetical protein
MAGWLGGSARLRTVTGTMAAIAAGVLLAPVAGLAGCGGSAPSGSSYSASTYRASTSIGTGSHGHGHLRQLSQLTASAAADVLAPDLRVAGLELLHRRDAAGVVKEQDLHAPGAQKVQVALERPGLAHHDARDLEE